MPFGNGEKLTSEFFLDNRQVERAQMHALALGIDFGDIQIARRPTVDRDGLSTNNRCLYFGTNGAIVAALHGTFVLACDKHGTVLIDHGGYITSKFNKTAISEIATVIVNRVINSYYPIVARSSRNDDTSSSGEQWSFTCKINPERRNNWVVQIRRVTKEYIDFNSWSDEIKAKTPYYAFPQAHHHVATIEWDYGETAVKFNLKTLWNKFAIENEIEPY